jgi:tricorn protease
VAARRPPADLATIAASRGPEFSFAFDDVGWRVENYGTDPHIEVDITPDTQLDRAIEEALKLHSPHPADRIRLVTPKLPPRPNPDRP